MARHPTATRAFLFASALVWLPYGLFCLWQPEYLHDAAGVAIASTTGRIELRAMYGGLQAAIGCLALAGVVRNTVTSSALTALAFLCGGLFLARVTGSALDGEVSAYTAAGLLFESASALGAIYLQARR